MAQSATRELTDENIFQLLAQGTLILMEDDLRNLQGEQAQVVKGKRVRGRLKITPQKGARMSTPPIAREGFLLKIKNKFANLKRPRTEIKKQGPSQAQPLTPSEVPFLTEQAQYRPMIAQPIPARPPVSLELTPAGISGDIPEAPRSAFPITDIKPSRVIKRKELASGLRLGEKNVEPAEEAKMVEMPLPPVPFAPKKPSVIQPLPDNLKAEPYAIDDLRERVRGKSDLEQEKSELDAKLQVFWPQRRPLELKVAALQEDKQALTKSLSPLMSKGAQVKAQEKDIAEKERKAQLPEERHQLEEQRWIFERQRQEIEKQKWNQEEGLEAKDAEIKAAKLQLQAVLTQEGALRGRKEAVVEELEKISLAQERLTLIDKAAGFDLQRRNLSKEKIALQAKENLFNKELKEASIKERAIEAQEASLEEAIEKVISFKDKKEIEQNRWRLDEQRRDIEQKRWDFEKNIEKNKEEVSILEKNYDEISRQQIATEVRAEEIDILLRHSFAEAKDILSVRNQQKDQVEAVKKQEIEERKEQIKPLLPILESVEKAAAIDDSALFQPKPTAEPSDKVEVDFSVKPQESGLAASEVLSEAEAQTAAKIRQKAQEREREKKLAMIQQKAQFQRESLVVPKIRGPISKADILLKLSQISSDEQVDRERFLARLAGRVPTFAVKPERNGKEVVFRPLVKKSSFFEKIFARIIFLLMIFIVMLIAAALVYFYIILPNPKFRSLIPPFMTGGGSPTTTVPPAGSDVIPVPVVIPTSTPEIPATPAAPTSTPAIVLPEPLVPVGETSIFEFSTTTEISGLLEKALLENKGVGLNRIVFQMQGQSFFDLIGFLAALQVVWPKNVSNLLEPEATLLVSGEGLASRFGFVVLVKDSAALASALRSWEPNMQNDWAGLWSVLGKTKLAEVSYFRSALSGGAAFRYQTFRAKDDFGICYAIMGDKFILATSGSQLKVIINELKKTAAL